MIHLSSSLFLKTAVMLLPNSSFVGKPLTPFYKMLFTQKDNRDTVVSLVALTGFTSILIDGGVCLNVGNFNRNISPTKVIFATYEAKGRLICLLSIWIVLENTKRNSFGVLTYR
jgi:hypothetical protein